MDEPALRGRALLLDSVAVPVVAHLSHWLLDALYLAPLVVLVGVLAVNWLRERRRASRG